MVHFIGSFCYCSSAFLCSWFSGFSFEVLLNVSISLCFRLVDWNFEQLCFLSHQATFDSGDYSELIVIFYFETSDWCLISLGLN